MLQLWLRQVFSIVRVLYSRSVGSRPKAVFDYVAETFYSLKQ